MIATKISNCSCFMYYKTEPQPIFCKDNPKNALHKAKRQKTSLSA